MRLGQLARKLDIKPSEVREFIREKFKVEVDIDLNTKIEEEHVKAIESSFASNKVVDETPAKIVNAAVEHEEHHAMHSPIEVPHYHEKSEEPETTETVAKVIDPFTPLPVDPDAEVIKVPKVQLEGLKVLGKIELPEKKKPSDVAENPADESQSAAEAGQESKRVKKSAKTQSVSEEESSIYKDKKGIYHFSLKQKQNRKDSLERIKREIEESKRKESKARYYKTVAAVEKKPESQEKKTQKKIEREAKKPVQKTERKGLWGKFVNWLNG